MTRAGLMSTRSATSAILVSAYPRSAMTSSAACSIWRRLVSCSVTPGSARQRLGEGLADPTRLAVGQPAEVGDDDAGVPLDRAGEGRCPLHDAVGCSTKRMAHEELRA